MVMRIKKNARKSTGILYTYDEIQSIINGVSEDDLLESYNKALKSRGESEKSSIKEVLKDISTKAYVSGRQELETELAEIQKDYPTYELNDMDW